MSVAVYCPRCAMKLVFDLSANIITQTPTALFISVLDQKVDHVCTPPQDTPPVVQQDEQHQVVLQLTAKPAIGATMSWYQAICTCGWRSLFGSAKAAGLDGDHHMAGWTFS